MAKEIDVFISCKDTDQNNNETIDLKVSKKIASLLRSKHFAVFLSDETLTEMGSSQYKKAIDAALDNTKAMIVVTSSREYADSNWVRYEWDSFYNDYLSGRRNNANLFTLTVNIQASDLPRTLRNSQCFKYDTEVEKLLNAITACLGERVQISEDINTTASTNSSHFSLIPPEEITPEQIKEVLMMESEVYSESEQQELNHCIELHKINPYIYLFFKDNNTGQIVGNIDINPISDE